MNKKPDQDGGQGSTSAQPPTTSQHISRDAAPATYQAGDVSAASEVSGMQGSALTYDDPTYTINRLEAANRPLRWISPNASVMEAVTIMSFNNFSQLPVMTTPREVKGVVTWQSIGVAKLARGRKADFVREVMEPPRELLSTDSIFHAIPVIVQKNYALIRGSENRITGIVTVSDLSLHFQQLSEPFLLLGEIENHIRGIIGDRFSLEQLESLREPGDAARSIVGAASLTFGEYIRLLEQPDRWTKIGLALDRVTFCEQLKTVRKIRNHVMHFAPSAAGLTLDDLGVLRDVVGLLRMLRG